MTFSKIGRIVTALVASAALGLGMTACGGGTIGYMWILGSANSQPTGTIGEITGFKIDDYTGNLTTMDHSPYASGGSNPAMLVVKPGGRYVYVVNSGSGTVPGSAGYVAGNIEEFSVGGGGILTAQQTFSSQGYHPVYLSFDTSGNFLYVLDEYAPDYNGTTNFNGSITAFAVAGDTGRLTLVPNTTILNPGGTPTTFFEVGPSPVMSRLASNGCLYTLSATSIYPYVTSSSTGQLTLPATGPQLITGSVSLTSINTSLNTSAGSYVYLTDGSANQILAYQTTGTGCSLSPIPASPPANIVANVRPVNSVTSNNGAFLYVLNQGIPSTTGTQGSSISAFTISAGVLVPVADPSDNPYAVGAGPLCAVEDPSNQYLYTSNSIGNTVTGKLLNTTRGTLADLVHGSTFNVAQNPTCLAVSGNI